MARKKTNMVPSRYMCPICNYILTEEVWSRLPRTTVDPEPTKIICPRCGYATPEFGGGHVWRRVGWNTLLVPDRIMPARNG